jgi:serine/threonine protein kinase
MTVGDTLVAGRYRVVRSLGRGGMGQVWLARDELLTRNVAIKELALPFGLTDEEREEMRQRTLREGRAAARLTHPNVVKIYDVQPGNERPWIVMEYVRARSLLEVIEQNGPLPVEQVATIGLAVLSALDAANGVGVVHRDVKPSNVLIADDGRVVLTDFGSALIDESEGALTRTGVILGSPRYIAPERARNGIATPESDMWSLGATLYEAVEGRAPYSRETTLETLVALATEKPDPVRLAGPLRPVLAGLLQKNPRARMRSADVAARLRRIAHGQNGLRPLGLPTPGRLTYQSPPWPNPATSAASGPAAGTAPRQRRPEHLGDLLDGELTPATAVLDVPSPAPAVDGPTQVRQAPVPPHTEGRIPPVLPTLRPVRFPARRLSRRRGLVAAGVAAVLLLVSGVVAFAVYSGGARPWAASASVRRPATGAAAAAGSAATGAVLPVGFGWYTGGNGFRLAYPRTYGKIQEDRTSVTYCAPGGPPLVGVRGWSPSDPDLSLAVAREESAADLDGYHRVRVTVSPDGDLAVWEYTFTDAKAGRLHGQDRFILTPGGGYVIQFRTPAGKWEQNRHTLGVITDMFRPAPAAPPAGTPPVGYGSYHSVSGFQVAYPRTYGKLEESRTSVTFCGPAGPPAVTVSLLKGADANLEKVLMEEEMMAEMMGQKGTYHRIGMQVQPGQGGAALEYTVTDPSMGGDLHGIYRVFVQGGRRYLIDFYTPADAWTANLATLGVITHSFRPAGTGSAV